MDNRPAIDLTKYHFVREGKGLRIYGTWYYDGEEEEPCLVVTRDDLRGKPGVIPLSSAYAYHDPNNGHRHLLTMSKLFNQHLFRSDTMNDVSAVADLIHGSLLDLITMPPKPDGDEVTTAELTLTNEYGQTMEVEVKENV